MAPKPSRQFLRRRDLIKLAWAGVALPIPLGSEGQRSGMPLVGVLSNGSASTRQPTVNAILEGLAETGFVDGQNVAIEFRWAGDDYDRFPELIADLMRRSVAVIVASGLNAALASRRSTATIPIIFGVGDDPVRHGLVTAFNQPGGNATGVSIQIAGLIGKRLSLLRELVPDAASIAVLVNPNDAQAPRQIADIREASNALGQPIELLSANTERDIEPAFASLARSGAKGLVLGVEQFFLSRRVQLVGLADRYAIPTIYALRAFVEAGGLVSYGPDLAYGDRQLGIYAGKILGGANPRDLPVIQTHKFELVINLQVATRLGLTVPRILLAQADDVIE